MIAFTLSASTVLYRKDSIFWGIKYGSQKLKKVNYIDKNATLGIKYCVKRFTTMIHADLNLNNSFYPHSKPKLPFMCRLRRLRRARL